MCCMSSLILLLKGYSLKQGLTVQNLFCAIADYCTKPTYAITAYYTKKMCKKSAYMGALIVQNIVAFTLKHTSQMYSKLVICIDGNRM